MLFRSNVADGQLEVAQTQEEAEPSERDVDLDDVDLDDIFAEVEEAKQAKAIVAEGAKKQKGNKQVAVCGDKKVWEDDSDDEEEESKGHKKVKVMQKGAVRGKKAPENKEEDQAGDHDDWPTHLLCL